MFIPEGFAQVNYIFDLQTANQEAEITHGIATDGLAVDLEQIADDLMANWDGAWGNALSNQWRLVRVDVRANLGLGDLEVASSTMAAQTGGDTGAPPSPQVAILVQKRTGFAGRHNRGRMYFPPVCNEGQISAIGTIDPTALAARQVIANNWLGDVQTTTGVVSMVVLHNDPSRDPRQVSALVVDSLVATQRRRLR